MEPAESFGLPQLSATATVTVVPDSLDFIAEFNIDDSTITVQSGASQPLSVTAFNRRGQRVYANVAWTVADPSIASIWCCYYVYGNSAGTTRIIGTVAGGLRDSVDVTVTP